MRPPGVFSAYSNYGAALAGEAAVQVSGKEFEQLVEEQITVPLGMTRTTFREPRPERHALPRAMSLALRGDLSSGFRWTPTGFALRAYE